MRRSSPTAAAGRATTSAASTGRRRSARSVSRFKANAISQEKTGEMLVMGKMFGMPLRGDFEHCEVAFFVGKNPWISHGIPHARTTLKAIAADPERAMIVIDPQGHRDRSDGRLPPAGAARVATPGWSRRWPPCSSTRASSIATWLAEHAVRLRPVLGRARRGADRSVLRDQRCRRGVGACRDPADRRGVERGRRSRTSACR